MTFTYVGTLATALDRVRFRIGDTTSDAARLTDEEIGALLSLHGGNESAAALGAVRALLGKIASQTDRSAVGLSSSRSQYTNHLRDLLRELEREAFAAAPACLVGVSRSETESTESDTDFRKSSFGVGEDDHP
jgi:hypothetical protein